MEHPCPDCQGSGKDAKKTEAAVKSGLIDPPPAYVRCWTCNGNGSDPAAYFNWH